MHFPLFSVLIRKSNGKSTCILLLLYRIYIAPFSYKSARSKALKKKKTCTIRHPSKLELCHWRDVYPHMLHWHRIFCMLSHKTREAYLWQFLRIIMPLSFMAILTFEILNSLAWYAIQCLWTKLMWRVILKSHNEWHSYGPDKLIYGHFWPLNSKCDLDLGDIDVILSRNTPSNNG